MADATVTVFAADAVTALVAAIFNAASRTIAAEPDVETTLFIFALMLETVFTEAESSDVIAMLEAADLASPTAYPSSQYSGST